MTITRLPTHVGDPTCAAAVVANGFVFAAHHAGGFESDDPAEQTRAALRSLADTLEKAGSSLANVVLIHLYLRTLDRAEAVWQVFGELFPDGAPARTTTTTDFFDPSCLVQLDAVAVATSHQPRNPI